MLRGSQFYSERLSFSFVNVIARACIVSMLAVVAASMTCTHTHACRTQSYTPMYVIH